ncbi:uncharacterized protein LOC112842455 [Oreochromis niloticus]|uniref:uncharacterized protein LOC112842455 n=1 Tax=Oreochromis niloticus TaxID=8128 RepID=UPI000DF33B04|nr:uncharacterized protein LOC112842455 [Oreochromis niloticus]
MSRLVELLFVGRGKQSGQEKHKICISRRYIALNYRLGDDAILPCDNAPPLDSTCSIVSWFHSRDLPWTTEVVHNGNIIEKTAQATRLSLYSNCFLGIKSITLKDSGVYYCRPGDNNALLTTVYLNILTTGIGVRYFYLYYKSGHDAILPCDNAPPLDSSCSIVHWLYSTDRSGTAAIVYNGAIEKNSARAARLSLHSNCHLGIKNITAEDAGGYCCRPGKNTDQDTVVYLHILNISASQTLNGDGDFTLECSLFRYSDLHPCEENSIRWLDETGKVLLDRGVTNTGRTCVSLLTVKHQRGHRKTYTCQFVKENSVKIEAQYTPVFTGCW